MGSTSPRCVAFPGGLFVRETWGAVLAASALLVGCGGGGGSGGGATGGNNAPAGAAARAPYIAASVASFPTGAVPPGFVQSGYNSGAAVQILDTNVPGAPVSNAVVSVNGMPLAYIAANQDYEADLSLSPGVTITLNVSVGGVTYTATGIQFPSYPAITAPSSGASWYSGADNVVAWSGVAPNANAEYALGVLDMNQQLVWPGGNAFLFLPATTSSYPIPATGLSAGNCLLLVGLATAVPVPNASAGSGLALSGFNYVPITVMNGLPVTLQTITVTPAKPTITVGTTQQLTATGTYSDTSTRDLTTQVSWLSSDTTKVTVGATGLASGAGYGSASVTASSGAISGGATVTVFQLNPSPGPPLSQAVAYQIDYAHSGYVVLGTPLSFPASPSWSVNLGGVMGYPLIAGGRVFVIAQAQPASTLYALDEATGNVLWSTALSPFLAGHAYDHGTLFVVDNDGLLHTFDAATGQAGWSLQLPGQAEFTSAPTAVNGVVYTAGAGIAGTLYAVDELTGNLLWTAGVQNGDESAPAVSSDGVFVSYPCQVYKFDPISGATLWHYAGPGEGGGGKTPAYGNGMLYVRDPLCIGPGQIFNGATGASAGTFASTTIPAISAHTGFFLNAGTLQSVDLASHNLQWSFVGDGHLESAPIVINNYVFVGSFSGNVYALDAATGAQIWSGNAGAAVLAPDEQNIGILSGIGAGEGYLVVPAGGTVTGWHIGH